MNDASGSWAARAAERVAARIAPHVHHWSPLERGIVLTIRTDYRERALAGAFTVKVVDADGTPRRVAEAEGRGPPLMILPGLYASLGESLFASIAELAVRRGRHVLLVEDRLAAGTLALTRGEIPSLSRIGLEIAAIARRLPAQPEALALSGGAATALAAPPGTFARIVTWSGALDIWVTAEAIARHPTVRWHYAQVHRRAFHTAGLPVPPLATIPAHLAAGAPCGPTPDPLLVLHAEDDPVVPASVAAALPLEEGQRAQLLPAGAHLGFGTLAGLDVYLLPFDESPS